MKLLKFGGSSMANAENIKKVAAIVSDEIKSSSCVVVLSAMQGTTDRLIEAGRKAESGSEDFKQVISEIADRHYTAINDLFDSEPPQDLNESLANALNDLDRICEGVFRVNELTAKTLDKILSFGELMSTRIFAAYMQHAGVSTIWKDSREMIKTNSEHGAAAVNFDQTNEQTSKFFAETESPLYILPGFIASSSDGATTTLGRGGSDYTAAIIAAAVDAEMLEIWTDVDGMMSADPRFVRNVRHITSINYREAMELSHFGAKVVYPPTIQPVMGKGIPILVKNTFDPETNGTLITNRGNDNNELISGITSIDNIAVLSLEGSGMVGIPGFSKRLFEALSRAKINVILITQSSSEHSICVAVEEKYASAAKDVVDTEFENEIAVAKIEPLRVETGFSILALVGENMRFQTGVSGRMFSTLGQNGINIVAIAQGSSERNISTIINSSDVRKAINTLHEEFFTDGLKQVNLYIAGVGTVGSRLLEQFDKQADHLREELRLNIRVVGMANSKQALFADEGIVLKNGLEELLASPQMNIQEFTQAAIDKNLRNSIFVDITASRDVVTTYSKLLERSISIIACNKIAASGELENYKHLKETSRKHSTNFFFETNVGAGLPIITTLNDLVRSGDRINRIEAVLSGTLNFVFNNYDGIRPFAEIVRQAQAEGYTEPDPRLDLSGTDVARKILILTRECGHSFEMTDIANKTFLPKSCFAGNVEDFYNEMAANEPYFKKLFADASAEGKSLKYIARFENGKASVGLESILPDHDFANLSGKDNAVLFYTDRYSEQPLVIKGAGAGAEVTAAGVFADIIRAART